MRRVNDLEAWVQIRPARACFTFGFFDGVHRGHQRLVEKLKELSDPAGHSVVVAFTKPGQADNLTSPDDRALLLENLGVDFLLELKLDERLSRLEPFDFLKTVVGSNVQGFVVGDDFRFGFKRSGGPEELKAFAHQAKIEIVQACLVDGIRVSSTQIREFLQNGKIELANQFLGRDYSLSGTRKVGDGLGSKLGFPTVNLSGQRSLLPQTAVYLGSLRHQELVYPAMLYLGFRPTLKSRDYRVEAHVLNHSIRVNPGEGITIHFKRKIRPDRAFSSLEDLKASLEEDKKLALTWI